MSFVLGVQVVTFIALGGMFIHAGDTKLGLAQLGLAVIQWLIYS